VTYPIDARKNRKRKHKDKHTLVAARPNNIAKYWEPINSIAFSIRDDDKMKWYAYLCTAKLYYLAFMLISLTRKIKCKRLQVVIFYI